MSDSIQYIECPDHGDYAEYALIPITEYTKLQTIITQLETEIAQLRTELYTWIKTSENLPEIE
jgi:hypothetical protein